MMHANFHEAAAAHGLYLPGDLVPDGRWHRVPTSDRPRARNGAYRLTPDGALLIQNHRTMAEPIAVRAASDAGALSPAIIARQRREQVDARDRLHRAAAERAKRIWQISAEAEAKHGYIVRKGLTGCHGTRLRGDALVIAYRIDGHLSTLQFIKPDGTKRFLRDGRKRGAYTCIGGKPRNVLAIVEGWATGASVHEATGWPVAVAGDAGNLAHVAKSLRRQFPVVALIICGDNDENGIGQRAAAEAAGVVNGVVKIPATIGMDWNDVAVGSGVDAVAISLRDTAPVMLTGGRS